MRINAFILGNPCDVRKLVTYVIQRKLKGDITLLAKDYGIKMESVYAHHNYAIFIGEIQWDEVRWAVRNGLKVLVTNPFVHVPKDLKDKISIAGLDVSKEGAEEELEQLLKVA